MTEKGLIEDQSGDEQEVADHDGDDPDGNDDHEGHHEGSVPGGENQAGDPQYKCVIG